MGLNDDVFGTVRSSIIQEEPLPKLKQILVRICKEEHHMSIIPMGAMEEKGGTTTAFAAINKTRPSSMAKLTCSRC